VTVIMNLMDHAAKTDSWSDIIVFPIIFGAMPMYLILQWLGNEASSEEREIDVVVKIAPLIADHDWNNDLASLPPAAKTDLAEEAKCNVQPEDAGKLAESEDEVEVEVGNVMVDVKVDGGHIVKDVKPPASTGHSKRAKVSKPPKKVKSASSKDTKRSKTLKSKPSISVKDVDDKAELDVKVGNLDIELELNGRDSVKVAPPNIKSSTPAEQSNDDKPSGSEKTVDVKSKHSNKEELIVKVGNLDIELDLNDRDSVKVVTPKIKSSTSAEQSNDAKPSGSKNTVDVKSMDGNKEDSKVGRWRTKVGNVMVKEEVDGGHIEEDVKPTASTDSEETSTE